MGTSVTVPAGSRRSVSMMKSTPCCGCKPGIPLLIPGETFNARIVDYLRFNREFARECPGFETDIHGLVLETGPDGAIHHYADCVAT